MDIRFNAILKLATENLDLLFPPVCAICNDGLAGGGALCGRCGENLPRVCKPFCEVCGEGFDGQIEAGFACPNCRGGSFHFEFARAALVRSEAGLDLIHRFKYGQQVHLAGELGRLACGAFADERLAVAMEERWPLVPVPLHWRKLQERFFNQAEEIANVIGEIQGLAVEKRLKRIRQTETQTRLSRRERKVNLKGAFRVQKPGFWQATDQVDEAGLRGVILIDDVFTTGSTVDECAKVLRKAGVRRVVVITVMRG